MVTVALCGTCCRRLDPASGGYTSLGIIAVEDAVGVPAEWRWVAPTTDAEIDSWLLEQGEDTAELRMTCHSHPQTPAVAWVEHPIPGWGAPNPTRAHAHVLLPAVRP